MFTTNSEPVRVAPGTKLKRYLPTQSTAFPPWFRSAGDDRVRNEVERLSRLPDSKVPNLSSDSPSQPERRRRCHSGPGKHSRNLLCPKLLSMNVRSAQVAPRVYSAIIASWCYYPIQSVVILMVPASRSINASVSILGRNASLR
jgi:hypothetical protein